MSTSQYITLDSLELTKTFIKRPSITPQDQGCQQIFIDALSPLGFQCEKMNFSDTENLWALKGDLEPVLIFAGHTDVVPPGDIEQWNSDPFDPVEKDGQLFGRGAADMKASLAAMITATQRFVSKHPNHKGSIGFLITSDEEGPFINGTTKVVDELIKRKQPITYTIVGEPSSSERLGDVVKIGRRGSLTGWLTIEGIQGHVAYPHLASNAIHEAIFALSELAHKEWDKGNEHFPATSFQITNINAGGGAGNIIPGKLNLEFNFRYSTEQTHTSLQQTVTDMLNKHQLRFKLKWKLNGEPFLTPSGELVKATEKAIADELNIATRKETSGGTSDGRFIAKTGSEIVELGPINASIHQINEHVNIEDIFALSRLYERIMENLLS